MGTKEKYKIFRIFSVLLLLVGAFAPCFGAKVKAETITVFQQGLDYNLDTDTGVLEITGSGFLGTGNNANPNLANNIKKAYTTDDNYLKIRNIRILNGIGCVSNLGFFFYGLENLETIEGLSNLNTTNVTNMRSLFQGCKKLESVDVSGFDTTKVTDMNHMFTECQSLKTLDLTAFSNCTKTSVLNAMFSSCSQLEELFFPFDTSLCMSTTTKTKSIFDGCTSLRILQFGQNTSFSTDSSLYDYKSNPKFDARKYTGNWQEVGSGTIQNPKGEVKTRLQLIQGATVPGTWVWEPIRYSLKYDLNYATPDNIWATQDFLGSDETVKLLSETPVRDGYKFLCWNTISDLTGTVYAPNGEFPNPLNNTTTLYAGWEKETYSLHYDPNGGQLGNVVTPQAFFGDDPTVKLTSEIPQFDGFDFVGWGISPDATWCYNPGDEIPNPLGNPDYFRPQTLWAIWRQSFLVENELRTVTRTIHYIDAVSKEKIHDDKVQTITFTRTVKRDPVTLDVVEEGEWSLDTFRFDEVISPRILNYEEPDKDSIEARDVTPDTSSWVEWVRYNHDKEMRSGGSIDQHRYLKFCWETDKTTTISLLDYGLLNAERWNTVDKVTGDVLDYYWDTIHEDHSMRHNTFVKDAIEGLTEEDKETVMKGYDTDKLLFSLNGSKKCVLEDEGLLIHALDIILEEVPEPFYHSDTIVVSPRYTEIKDDPDGTKTVKRTIHYQYEDESEAAEDKVQTATFTRKVFIDELDGSKVYGEWDKEEAEFEQVESPTIANYVPDKPFVETTTVPRDSDDLVETVTYKYREGEVDNTAPVHRESTVTRMIHYVYEDDSEASPDITQSFTFKRDGVTDLETGETAWKDWAPGTAKFEEVVSPEIANYVPDKTKVETREVNGDSGNIEVTVTYKKMKDPKPDPGPDPEVPTKTPQPITIHYVDDKGNTIHSSLVIHGEIGDVKRVTAPSIEWYMLVTKGATQSFTVSDKKQSFTFVYKRGQLQDTMGDEDETADDESEEVPKVSTSTEDSSSTGTSRNTLPSTLENSSGTSAKSNLPTTGELQEMWIIAIGGLLTSVGAVLYIKRKQKV